MQGGRSAEADIVRVYIEAASTAQRSNSLKLSIIETFARSNFNPKNLQARHTSVGWYPGKQHVNPCNNSAIF